MVIPGILDGSPEIRKGDPLEITYYGLTYNMKVMKVVDDKVYLEFKVNAGSFFVRFYKNLISSKAQKLDFYQKLDFKSQKTRF